MSRILHLAGRFARSLVARRPSPADQEFVARYLDPPLTDVFWDQPVPDLAQALRGARRILAVAPDRADLIRAFLLHDVGKRHSRLGTWTRSAVTAAAMVRIPVGGRGRAYLGHAALGAAELEALGCELLVVAFARHHDRARPPEIDGADWDLLVSADRP